MNETRWQRLRSRAFITLAGITRGMTLGVRTMLIDGDKVLLIRHTYVPGWHFPGGGVERGETAEASAAREVMEERLQRLQAALGRHQLAFNQASVGRRCAVLVERKGRKPGQWLGKSPWLQSVHFEGPAAVGDLVEVELAAAGPNSLAGELLIPAAA